MTPSIPKPSKEIIEKFDKIIGAKAHNEPERFLLSKDHTIALITENMSLDDLKLFLSYDERLHAGFWRFDGRFVRRKRHNGINVNIKIGNLNHPFDAGKLANILKIAGKKVHLYICDRGGGWYFLLVLSDRCGICLAPVVEGGEYKELNKVATRLDDDDTCLEEGCVCFLDNLSYEDVVKLIERLGKELGILHM